MCERRRRDFESHKRWAGLGRSLANAVGEVDEELCEAAFCGGVVAENGGEGGVAERLGETLSEGFASTGVIAQSTQFLA